MIIHNGLNCFAVIKISFYFFMKLKKINRINFVIINTSILEFKFDIRVLYCPVF